jgi:hypothetical protein
MTRMAHDLSNRLELDEIVYSDRLVRDETKLAFPSGGSTRGCGER